MSVVSISMMVNLLKHFLIPSRLQDQLQCRHELQRDYRQNHAACRNLQKRRCRSLQKGLQQYPVTKKTRILMKSHVQQIITTLFKVHQQINVTVMFKMSHHWTC
ncbi:hypothetical protein ACF0H5_005604 [Mactra antiquata]